MNLSKITEIPDEYLGIYSENSRAVAAGDLRIWDLEKNEVHDYSLHSGIRLPRSLCNAKLQGILLTESDTFADRLCEENFPSKHKFLVIVTKGWANNSVNRFLSILVLKYTIPVYLASNLDLAGCEMGHCYSKGNRIGIEQTKDELEHFYIPILERIGLDRSDVKNNSPVIIKRTEENPGKSPRLSIY